MLHIAACSLFLSVLVLLVYPPLSALLLYFRRLVCSRHYKVGNFIKLSSEHRTGIGNRERIGGVVGFRD
jgi:hypothetical protein